MRFTVESGVAHTKTAVRMSSLGMLYYRVHWFRVWFSSSVQHIPCRGQAQSHSKLANFREVTLGWKEGGSKRQLFPINAMRDGYTCTAVQCRQTLHCGLEPS